MTYHDDIKPWLAANGWREHSEQYRYGKDDKQPVWYKRFEDAPRCRTNHDKPGTIIGVKVYECGPFGDSAGYEVVLLGNKPDDVPVQLMCHCINDGNLIAELEAQCAQLVAAWTVMHTMSKPKP